MGGWLDWTISKVFSNLGDAVKKTRLGRGWQRAERSEAGLEREPGEFAAASGEAAPCERKAEPRGARRSAPRFPARRGAAPRVSRRPPRR